MAAMDNPPLEILAREPEGFSVWSGPPFSNGQPQVKLERVTCSMAKFCENGLKLLVMKNNSTIRVYNASSLVEIKSFEVASVQAATLSPCGTYVKTFQKCSTPQDKNLILWNAELGIPVYQQHQKNITKSTWESLRAFRFLLLIKNHSLRQLLEGAFSDVPLFSFTGTLVQLAFS